MICQWEGTGRKCTEEAKEHSIFCEGHKNVGRYIGLVSIGETEAEELARHIRMNGVSANVYQYYFVIIGPTNQPAHYFQNGGPCFEYFRYEDVLDAFIKEAQLIYITDPAPTLLHPKLLTCPKCDRRHIDQQEEDGKNWARIPHRKHLCHYCGHLWRPFNYHTIGV